MICNKRIIGYYCNFCRLRNVKPVVSVRLFCQGKNLPEPWHKTILTKYENFLQTRAPGFYKLHRIVVDGSKTCYSDLKTYIRISSEIRNGKPLDDLTRQELEVFILTPADIEKVTMIVFIVALPMTIFLLAAAVVFFPRILLTRHFWTVKQTLEFTQKVLSLRRQHYFPQVAKYFVEALKKTKTTINTSAFTKALSGSSVISLQEQLKSSAIFCNPSVQVDQLPWSHQIVLGRSHGMVPVFKTAHKLKQRSDVVQALDKKLRNENLVSSMSPLELYTSLFIRQINVENMNDDQKREALQSWLQFTKEPKTASWLLHAPVFAQLPKPKSPAK